MYKYLFFDLDGTLTESGEGIINSAEYAFKKMGMEVPSRAELASFVGPPLVESFPRFGVPVDEADNAVRIFREYFNERGWKENRPYPGVADMCKTLKDKGFKLVVATSKIERMAIRVMDYFGLSEYFTAIIGSDDGPRSKKADVVAYALKTLNIDNTDDVVMIGDRCYDVEGAAANGIKTVGVTYGYGSEKELLEAGAIAIVHSAEELQKYLCGGNRNAD